jgi:subtilase family serine protease
MAQTKPLTTTIVFKLRHVQQLQRYIRQTVTPGSANYRKFLSPQTFRAKYAPNQQQIQQVKRYLTAHGIRVQKVFANHLAMKVSGPASAFERNFNVQIRYFQQIPATKYRRQRFHRPMHAPTVPGVLRKNGVLAIVGLSNQYKSEWMHTSTGQLQHSRQLSLVRPQARVKRNTIATGVPGQYTVGDVANIYNVNPLYKKGINGAGTTVGIATYARFLPSDAITYWNLIGLNYKPNRITQVHVDGGGDFGADAGTGETSLDVEQSGGLAPFANIIEYDAPNSTQGGIDMFNRIVSDNKVDSLSYSWGLPEIFYYPQLNGGVDARPELQALNQIFMEAAAQGMSFFTASGDSGAYDTNRSLPYPDFSKILSADAPSVSPYMTAAGGTTLPISLIGSCGNGTTVPITIGKERAWGWDYLAGFYQRCYGETPVQAGIFASGDGGGISVYFKRPYYQNHVRGIRKTQPYQALIDYSASAYVIAPRGGYAGRNVPDISMNADPESGYYIYSTPDGGLLSGYGGTSFVAPQLNGITALFNANNGGRLGLLNPQLYRLLRQYGYGKNSPFNDIAKGDNWFWHGVSGYDTATGVGTPNVAKLSAALKGR